MTEEETTATVAVECGGCRRTLSTTIAALAKAGVIPARTMTAEAAAEAAVAMRRIVTPPPSPGSGLRFYPIAPTVAVECLTSYTAAVSASASAAVAAASAALAAGSAV